MGKEEDTVTGARRAEMVELVVQTSLKLWREMRWKQRDEYADFLSS